jgi:hypothetical protein
MTAYSLQLSCLFVSSGLPVGLHFLLLQLFENILCFILMAFAAPCAVCEGCNFMSVDS